MISDIYVMAVTLWKDCGEDEVFNTFVEKNYPKTINSHLPEGIKFHSIEYKEDPIVESLLYQCFDELADGDMNSFFEKMDVSFGYYHLKFEGLEDLTRKELPFMEFVFQKLHEEYLFISSYFFYIKEDGLQYFVKMYTYESNRETEDEEVLKDLDSYTRFVDSYFYLGEIPEDLQAIVAKMLLLKEDR